MRIEHFSFVIMLGAAVNGCLVPVTCDWGAQLRLAVDTKDPAVLTAIGQEPMVR